MPLLLGGSAPAGAAADIWLELGMTPLKAGAFIAIMLVIGRRVFPRLLWHIAATGSRELFILCVVIGWSCPSRFSR